MAIDDRLLRVLRAFNERAPASVVEISADTGISRPAVYRIVQTLCQTRYLRRRAVGAVYEPTEMVLALSVGYRQQSWISVSGAKAIARLQDQVTWPTTLATHDRGFMIVRETTRFRSPLVFDLATIGMTIPMFRTALGLAYYTHCNPKLQHITRNLASPEDVRSLPTDAQLKQIQRRGYAIRIGGVQPATSSIAVPLLARSGPIGAICVTFAKTALSARQAALELLPPLRRAALEIMHACEQDSQGPA